jgi:sterol desaturase/sphingolipid hydroxylase (fatty acid hydroxylase superfamily)
LLIAEQLFPRRANPAHQSSRRCHHVLLVGINTLVMRLLLPMGPLAIALLAEQRGWGFFNVLSLPYGFSVVLAVICLDLVLYLQHVLFHALPGLWRLHKVHHADLHFDATTGFRFHTLEVVVSGGIKIAAVVILGAPALAVLLFEVLLNASAMFSHANLRLPLWADRVLRLVLVTPDMHRVHHSILEAETNSNYGFCLPWWDYLFRTYRSQPEKGHEAMTTGLAQLRDERVEKLPWILALPFVRDEPFSDANQEERPTPGVPQFKPTQPL